MRGTIRARSTWPPPAPAARRIWRANCSTPWPESTCCTSPIAARAPAISDLLSGQVQILFAAAPGTADYIRAGKLRALAVTAPSQADVLRELPTVGSAL